MGQTTDSCALWFIIMSIFIGMYPQENLKPAMTRKLLLIIKINDFCDNSPCVPFHPAVQAVHQNLCHPAEAHSEDVTGPQTSPQIKAGMGY